jgi:hypothetical protein
LHPANPKLFALDENFPEPIIRMLDKFITVAEFVSVRHIDPSFPGLDDWQLIAALHNHDRPWDGLITMDRRMLSLAPELNALIQTGLTLVVVHGQGHNPIRATGLVLTHIDHICGQTRPGRGQVWDLSAAQRDHKRPLEYLEKLARMHNTTAQELMRHHQLPPGYLRPKPGPSP